MIQPFNRRWQRYEIGFYSLGKPACARANDVDDVAFETQRQDQSGRALKDSRIPWRAGAIVVSLQARRNQREPTCRNICVGLSISMESRMLDRESPDAAQKIILL